MKTVASPVGSGGRAVVLLRRASTLALLCLSMASASRAAPIAAVFQVDDATSSLKVTATATVSFVSFSDHDEQALAGMFDALLDFGDGGDLPTMAGFEITGAAVTHAEPYQLTLGQGLLSATVTVTDAVVDVTTPSPPATLTLIDAFDLIYQFDAAEFEIAIVEGSAAVSGVLPDSEIDFSETPAAGMADPGTLGTLALSGTPNGGGDMSVDAVIELPIDFVEVVDFEGVEVELDVEGIVVARSSFVLGPPTADGDFDGNGQVDGADFLIWQRGELPDGVTIDNLAEWEANFGEAGLQSAAMPAPEPTAMALASIGLIATLAIRVRLRKRSESS